MAYVYIDTFIYNLGTHAIYGSNFPTRSVLAAMLRQTTIKDVGGGVGWGMMEKEQARWRRKKNQTYKLKTIPARGVVFCGSALRAG